MSSAPRSGLDLEPRLLRRSARSPAGRRARAPAMLPSLLREQPHVPRSTASVSARVPGRSRPLQPAVCLRKRRSWSPPRRWTVRLLHRTRSGPALRKHAIQWTANQEAVSDHQQDEQNHRRHSAEHKSTELIQYLIHVGVGRGRWKSCRQLSSTARLCCWQSWSRRTRYARYT